MEIGRRFGNQVGDPLASKSPDVRGNVTAQGYQARNIQPTGPWAGGVQVYVNEKRAGAFTSDPFFFGTPANRRVFFEFFLYGRNNSAEDLRRYLRTVPGNRVELEVTRNHVDAVAYGVYHTAGLTNVPSVRLAVLRPDERVGGTSTAALMRFVSDVLPAGGHSFRVRPTDTAGNEKTSCPVLTTVLAPWPAPPTGVEVHSYDPATGRVAVKWSHAVDYTAGSKYLVYRNAGQDGRVQYGTAVKSATHPVAVTGSPSKPFATFTLPLTGPAAAGVWVAGVRHRRSSITEDNFSALARFQITQDGSYSADGYPHAPSYREVEKRPAARLLVRWKHDNAEEENRTLRFKVYRSPGNVATVSYATAVATIQRTAGRFVDHTAGFALTHGMAYRFVVRSYATAGIHEVNTATVAGTPDGVAPTSCPAVSLAKVLS